MYFGDAARAAMLTRVGLERASALVLSMNDAQAAERVLQTARQLTPAVPILVRARDRAHAERLNAQGATQVVPEVLESGLQLGALMLAHTGMSVEAARDTGS